ncbi:arf-GAP with coiled-coil, ANK repeat and PH domain-containing protein 3-like isoform X2 [Oculina patagonica]
MTFYDNYYEASTPDLPSYEFVLDDSPSCHQSLKYWTDRAAEISPALSKLTGTVESYYNTGMQHSKAAAGFGTALSEVAKTVENDKDISEPIMKFADMLQRIECYRDMFLSQTEILTLKPLAALTKEFEKAKELQSQMQKARDALHISWEKYSSLSHQSNLQEPSVVDKLAHGMLHARHNYQRVLLKYVSTLRDIHTLKKVIILQKVLEHMLAQFSFFNFAYQTLKDVEPYMNDLFQELQNTHAKLEDNLQDDEDVQASSEADILTQYQKDAQSFAEPQTTVLGSATLGHSVTTVNVQAGKFFNKIGDLFQGSTAGSKKTGKDQQRQDQEWEVVEKPGQSSSPQVSRKDETSSSSQKPKPPRPEPPSSLPSSPAKKKESPSHTPEDDAQEKVIKVVPDDLLSPSTEVTPQNKNVDQQTDDSRPIQISTGKGTQVTSSQGWEQCKRGYLRIKQKGFPKSRWPLLYFIVDQKDGRLLAQGQEQISPSVMENLLLCTVKFCGAADADRNNCFQLISPSSERIFQAVTDQEVQEWVTAIQKATADALRNSKAKLQSLARSQVDRSSSSAANSKKVFVLNASERIRKIEGNTYCADCSAPRPDWASINLGILVCIECSGIHRSLGVHVSKVRSLTLDKWEELTVKFMEGRGNDKVNRIYEGNLGEHQKPTRDCTKEERKKFIRAKYIDRNFYIAEESSDQDLQAVMKNRPPGEDEDELFNDSAEFLDFLQERSLNRASPVCLVED